MKNWKTYRVAITAFVLGVFISSSFAYTYTASYFEISKNLEIFSSVYKELSLNYVEDVEAEEVMETGIDAMLESLDPYTNYMTGAEIQGARFQQTGKYGGIGASTRKIGDYVVIADADKDNPAGKAGMKPGDKIVKIGNKDAVGKSSREISKGLKGQPGTTVSLTVLRPKLDGSEEELTFEVERADIQTDIIPYTGMVEDGVGYIKLSSFTQTCSKDVFDALMELREDESLESIVLDLRGNPGGLLDQAVNITNLFVEKNQEIVSMKGKLPEYNKKYNTLNDPVDLDIPLAVLVDGNSASASEIVSGAIQDLDRGVVIGQQSFGKGLVQIVKPLPYNTQMKITTAYYYTPSGRCVQALNYSERDASGKATNFAEEDSLRTAFKTTNGRTVYDGRGVDPDVEVDNKKLSKITRNLMRKGHIFNFATQYSLKHESIAKPRDFKLTDAEYQEFVKFIEGKDISYTTKSEKLLKSFKESAEDEEYFGAIEQEFASLEAKMMSDKEQDLDKQEDEIRMMIELEIVSRYHNDWGVVQAAFTHDEELKKAIEILNNEEKYLAILNP